MALAGLEIPQGRVQFGLAGGEPGKGGATGFDVGEKRFEPSGQLPQNPIQPGGQALVEFPAQPLPANGQPTPHFRPAPAGAARTGRCRPKALPTPPPRPRSRR